MILLVIHNSYLIQISRRKGYVYTSVDPEENPVISNSFKAVISSPPNNQQNYQIQTVDELDKTSKFKKTIRNLPSVKVRLFRKNSKAKRKSTLEFDANDFDVPLQKPTRAKKVAFNPRISRSDWDIYDSRTGSEMREELEMLLSRNSKELSIRSKSPEYDDFKSQYFDALETLSEDEEEVPSKISQDDHRDQRKAVIANDDDEYEDIEEEVKPEELKSKPHKRNHFDLKSQPVLVQKKVKALKKLLYQQKQIESEMFKDIHKLEGYFYKIHTNKFYNERLKQVEGELNQSTIIEEDENEEDGPREELQQQGIPGFWLRVLLNSKNLSQIVQAADVPVLNNLVDVRVFNFENPLGFRLTFTFKTNEYFIDTELTKDYFLKCEPAEDENPLLFEGKKNFLKQTFFLF